MHDYCVYRDLVVYVFVFTMNIISIHEFTIILMRNEPLTTDHKLRAAEIEMLIKGVQIMSICRSRKRVVRLKLEFSDR